MERFREIVHLLEKHEQRGCLTDEQLNILNEMRSLLVETEALLPKDEAGNPIPIKRVKPKPKKKFVPDEALLAYLTSTLIEKWQKPQEPE